MIAVRMGEANRTENRSESEREKRTLANRKPGAHAAPNGCCSSNKIQFGRGQFYRAIYNVRWPKPCIHIFFCVALFLVLDCHRENCFTNKSNVSACKMHEYFFKRSITIMVLMSNSEVACSCNIFAEVERNTRDERNKNLYRL